MDPTNFLTNQVFQRKGAGKPSPEEIDTFYESHGPDLFVAISRWRARLSTTWYRIHNRQERGADIAPIAHRG